MSDREMELRQKVYSLLLSRFGSQVDKNGDLICNMKSITECADDWISRGNVNTSGIVKYYEAYYA